MGLLHPGSRTSNSFDANDLPPSDLGLRIPDRESIVDDSDLVRSIVEVGKKNHRPIRTLGMKPTRP